MAEVGLERGVVTEPLRLLIGIHMATHPGQQGGVVHDLTVGLIQAQDLGQPHADQALTQHMLHRLAHTQVSCQRQNAQQFGQTDTRASRRLCHSLEYRR
jgi:hypothetical protein